MEPKYTHTLHSDLPETVIGPDHSVHKYSVPEHSQLQTTVYALPTDDRIPPLPVYDETGEAKAEHGKWSRWPLLLLYGVLLMVIAGVAGGFIGKTIERNNHSNNGAVSIESQTCPTSTSASAPSSSLSSALAATPTPSSAIFERTIAQPSSGCSSSAPYRSFKSRSNFINIPFTTICGQGWLEDDITAMSVATQSDCIESCSQYNAQRRTNDRTCVGGGFIPEWWNQTRAMVESGITPYNCFLKANTSGIARNNEKFEVIALCMDGQCDNIVG